MTNHKDPRQPLRHRIETERLELVPLGRFAAFRQSYKWNSDPEILRSIYFTSKPMRRWKWYRRFVKPIGKHKFAHAIVPKGSDRPIGMHTVYFQGGHRSVSLTVVIDDRAWWGRKVVEELRARIVDIVFEADLADRICSAVAARNMPSIFNYKKLGFSHVGTFHKSRYDPVTQELEDMVFFELLREDWASRRPAHV